MANSTTKRQAALAQGELPTYARSTRASITRTTGLAGGTESGLRCPHKACSCSANQHLASKPTPPMTQPVTATSMLGKYRHDRAGRTGKGRGYRPGKIGLQAGRGPSQLLQCRIRQLARGIKDKRTNQATGEIETSVTADDHEQQVTVSVTEDSDSASRFDHVIQTKSFVLNVNAAEMFGARKVSSNINTISEDSRVVWESDQSDKLSTGDKISGNKTESRTNHRDENGELTDIKVAITEQPTPPDSPPQQRKTRRSAVFEAPKIDPSGSEPPRLFDDNKLKGPESVSLIVQPLPEPSVRKSTHSHVRNKEQTESDLSFSTKTIREEAEPLTVEYPSDLPARYRIPVPSIEESVRSELLVPMIVQPSVRKTTHSPARNKERTESDLSSTIREEAEPLTIEYPPDLPARYRSLTPSIRESISYLDPGYPPDLPLHRRPSQSHSENFNMPPRFKSRTPSLVPPGATLLGWTPAGAGRDRSNSVINISSAYRARRTSVFGLGLNAPSEEGSSGTRSLSISSTQSRRSSVADIFRRSKQSRHRRLSVYLQTPGSGKERAIDRLKRVLKTVKIIAGICLALKRYAKTGETKQWSLVEMHLNLRADMEKTLAFDPILFSKLRVTRGSEKLRSILSTKSSDRSREDIEVILALLRKNRTFADYDRETQIAFAKVMEYLRYEARRVILKEGHRASGFYIILSGTCLVNQKEIDPRNNQTFVRTVDEIHTGDSFGDIELLNDCLRTVSIICKDECEVLLVDKEDFNIIIREPLEMEREKLLNFCSTQNVFEKLPTNLDFRGDHYAISAKKFRPGVVITSDICESDFIYVVRSGKCRVISEVKEIKRRPSLTKKARHKPFSNEDWKKDAPLKRSLTVMEAMGSRRKWASEPKLFQKQRQKTFFSLTGIKKSVDFADANDEKDVPPIMPKSLFDEKDQLQTKPNIEEPDDKSGVITTWRRVSMAASAVTEKERRKNPLLYLKPSRLKSTYAEVAVLKEGDVFGVETLVTSGQSDTRLSLVSEGADCVVISKKFFATHATVSAIQQSIKKAIEYPSAEYTLNKIRQARAWSSYKDSLVKDVCSRKMVKAGELCR